MSEVILQVTDVRYVIHLMSLIEQGIQMQVRHSVTMSRKAGPWSDCDKGVARSVAADLYLEAICGEGSDVELRVKPATE